MKRHRDCNRLVHTGLRPKLNAPLCQLSRIVQSVGKRMTGTEICRMMIVPASRASNDDVGPGTRFRFVQRKDSYSTFNSTENFKDRPFL